MPPRTGAAALPGFLLVILLAPLLLLPAPPEAAAWGCAGHVIVATGATQLASPETRVAVAELLDGESLGAASCWLDDIRPSRPDTKRWHYVDVPLGAASYDPVRDCAATAEGDCLVAAIGRARTALGDRGRSPAERAEALRVLAHLVGDLHQPLHCADHDDHGGNEVEVEFRGEPTNLHALWDTGLIEQELRESWTWPGFPESVYARLAAEDDARRGEIVDWAMETHAVAAREVYGRLPSDRRRAREFPRPDGEVLRRQLARAAVRLAAILDAALVEPRPGNAGASPSADASSTTRRPVP